jgi:sugar phosphate isomerase/epimerase
VALPQPGAIAIIVSFGPLAPARPGPSPTADATRPRDRSEKNGSSEMTDRRSFLHALGAVALGGSLPAALHGTTLPHPLSLSLSLVPSGIQLYTLRTAMAEDFDGTLERVSEIGYGEVEFAGYLDRTPAQVRTVLDRVGLKAPATHLGIEQVRDDLDAMIESARTIGIRWLVVPSLPGSMRSIEGYREVAAILNRAGERAKAAGVGVGFHNHDVELRPVDGRVPLDILIEETDPALVTFELDLYWISRAGRDPLEYLNAHPGRFTMVHVKDMDASDEMRMVNPGEGIIDFPAIHAARERAGIRHWFVEHDRPADPWQTARTGFTYLNAL